MPTNTAATKAREYQTHQVHYQRKDFSYADTGAVLSIGTLPAGAFIIPALSGVQVHIAFTAGTNKRLDVGTPANDDLYGTDLTLAAIGFVPLDETTVTFKVLVDTDITATPDLTGSTNTAGEASVIIAYTVKDGI